MQILSALGISGRGRRLSGFTLIELLVVMAIITILAGLLFPTFMRARGSARQKSCASNLRQCAIALRLYRDDHDDLFPPQNLSALSGITNPSPRHVTGPESAIWVGELYPYLRMKEVLYCKQANRANVDTLNGMPYAVGINVQLTELITSG